MIKQMIVLFVLLMSINITSGTMDSFVQTGSSQISYDRGYFYDTGLALTERIRFQDVGITKGIEYVTVTIPHNLWGGSSGGSAWYEVTYRLNDINGVILGTGYFGYNKGLTNYYIMAFFDDDFDISGYSGTQIIYIQGASNMKWCSYEDGSLTDSNQVGFMCSYFDLAPLNGGSYTVYTAYEVINEYEYLTLDDSYSFEIFRDTGNQSNITITDNGGNVIVDETVLKSTSQEFKRYDVLNYTWSINWNNPYDDVINRDIVFDYTPLQSSAEITLNQTSYTSPEIIKSDISLSNSDFNNNYYRIKTMYSPLNNIYDYTSVIYNQSQIISSDESSYLITLNENYYDLPIKLMITVEQYNKNTGVSTVIAESNKVLYNPTAYYDFIYEGYVLNVLNNAYISDVDISFNNGINYINTTSNYKGYFKVYLTVNEYDVIVTHDDYNTWVYNDVFIEKAQTTNIYLAPLITGVNLYGNVQNFNDLSPLSNVKILISNNTFSTYVYTNNYGYFEVLNIINNENYTVCTEYENYYNYNELIQTELTGTTHLNILLIPITYDDIDEDIALQIDELKKEIQPIKDLIFGLSEIVIDNPDYNDDNIITQNEYSTWINSFISIAIVIFIVIIAIGLKERRSKKL